MDESTLLMQALEMGSQLATKEVVTVIGGLTIAYLGWKATSKSIGIAGSFAQKFTFVGLAAALMIMGGAGGTGLGIGELVSRWTSEATPSSSTETIEHGIPNDQLIVLADKFNGHSNPEQLKHLTDYARERDGFGKMPSDELMVKLVQETKEENAAAVTALIELFKARQTDNFYKKSTEIRTASSTTTSAVKQASYETEDEAPETPSESPSEDGQEVVAVQEVSASNADSMMSLPYAMMAILIGIASMVSGGVVYKHRKDPETPTTA